MTRFNLGLVAIVCAGVLWILGFGFGTSAAAGPSSLPLKTVAATLPAVVPPASLPAVIPTDNLAALAQVVIAALNLRNWPVLVVCVLVGFLIFERHYEGLTGNRFSQWLGTKLGLLCSSLFSAVVTAAAGVASQGWKAIGNACIAAAIVAGITFLAQFVGPAAKAPIK